MHPPRAYLFMEIIQLTYWSPEDVPQKKGPLWQVYSPDTSDEEAELDFVKRYGYKPEKQKRYDSCLLVGPIKEE